LRDLHKFAAVDCVRSPNDPLPGIEVRSETCGVMRMTMMMMSHGKDDCSTSQGSELQTTSC